MGLKQRLAKVEKAYEERYRDLDGVTCFMSIDGQNILGQFDGTTEEVKAYLAENKDNITEIFMFWNNTTEKTNIKYAKSLGIKIDLWKDEESEED